MIEVVIRNLKLVVLQAIAPIPIVSYMNPNDKMLGNWVKQYVGVYFSLFLQLLAITLIPNLMMSLLESVTGGFIIKIIIIAGCLLFTKEAPKFIGKLLGLENMSGSFGDAFKMVKTGLGIGAGAAAGLQTCKEEVHVVFVFVACLGLAIDGCIASRVYSRLAPEGFDFEPGVVGEAVEAIVLLDVLCLDEGIGLEGGACLGYVDIAADVAEALDFVAVAEYGTNLLELVSVVAREY